VDVVEYLISVGARLTNEDKKGNLTPYTFAKKFNKTQILEVFRRLNAVPESDALK
jgi:hypothetical protein